MHTQIHTHTDRQAGGRTDGRIMERAMPSYDWQVNNFCKAQSLLGISLGVHEIETHGRQR